jgi:hypothetical protein
MLQHLSRRQAARERQRKATLADLKATLAELRITMAVDKSSHWSCRDCRRGRAA